MPYQLTGLKFTPPAIAPGGGPAGTCTIAPVGTFPPDQVLDFTGTLDGVAVSGTLTLHTVAPVLSVNPADEALGKLVLQAPAGDKGSLTVSPDGVDWTYVSA